MSARERAKTETGLGLGLRGSTVGSPITPNEGSGGAAGLWAGGEGVVRRELSVATKLNIPPPLRPMQPRQSGTISPHVPTGAGSGSAASPALASGVYPGSGGALASMGNGTGSGSGSQQSFTEQVGRLPGARRVSCKAAGFHCSSGLREPKGLGEPQRRHRKCTLRNSGRVLVVDLTAVSPCTSHADVTVLAHVFCGWLQAAGSSGSFRKAPLGARSERRMVGSSSSGGGLMAPGGGDWRSKLQNLSTAIVQSPNSLPPRGGADEEVLPQRSRLSETPRAVRWDTVQVRRGTQWVRHQLHRAASRCRPFGERCSDAGAW